MNPLSEREAEILKPLASVEVTEKEDAMFETEISEDDVPGEWKLKGEVLTRSPVRLIGLCMHIYIKTHCHYVLYINVLEYIHQTCEIQMEGGVRKLTLRNCQLDQAGEVSYQALNAVTSAMLNVKGKQVLLLSLIGISIFHHCHILAVKIKA